MFRNTLRTKFLLALVLISGSLTWATLFLVRHLVELRVREEIAQGLRNSVSTFQSLQQQRESTLERSAALLAALPPLKAVMTSQDRPTIQDASGTFWNLIGSELFVLTDRTGNLMALHTSSPGFTETAAQQSISHSLANHESRDWWFGGGHLFEVFLQPIYFGSPDDSSSIGILAVGYEINSSVAAEVGRVASGRVAFLYQNGIVVSTVSDTQRAELARSAGKIEATNGKPEEIQLGQERFLATSVALSSGNSRSVTLTVLKSFDEETAFLANLNRWILGIGAGAVLAGGLLVFWVSTTFTRPLAELVGGVRALGKGDFSYPLRVRGHDEVSELTSAFDGMRARLQETQQQLLEAERLATIGRMARMISHDLRHPLTAILAYAEFLSEGNLPETQRKDFFQEIRIAINRMTDELNSLMGFSKQKETIRPVYGNLEEVIHRAIQNVKVLPEFEGVEVAYSHTGSSAGWFDPAKIERVVLNLLFNACEAISPRTGKVEIHSDVSERGIEITVADNGPGIPASIRENLFQPFVSFGKETGIGLGLTVVKKIVNDHRGEVQLESTSPHGSVFKITLPASVPADPVTSAD